MKKHLSGKALIIAFFTGGILAGCSKEINVKSPPLNAQTTQTAQSPASSMTVMFSNAGFISKPFISQVNTTTVTDSGILFFDFILRKRFETQNKHLFIGYGDQQFTSRGWKYEITVDSATGEILLSPNDKMKTGIVRGSFQTVSATFEPTTNIFNFVTRFKELNGNKNEVGETISKNF